MHAIGKPTGGFHGWSQILRPAYVFMHQAVAQSAHLQQLVYGADKAQARQSPQIIERCPEETRFYWTIRFRLLAQNSTRNAKNTDRNPPRTKPRARFNLRLGELGFSERSGAMIGWV